MYFIVITILISYVERRIHCSHFIRELLKTDTIPTGTVAGSTTAKLPNFFSI